MLDHLKWRSTANTEFPDANSSKITVLDHFKWRSTANTEFPDANPGQPQSQQGPEDCTGDLPKLHTATFRICSRKVFRSLHLALCLIILFLHLFDRLLAQLSPIMEILGGTLASGDGCIDERRQCQLFLIREFFFSNLVHHPDESVQVSRSSFMPSQRIEEEGENLLSKEQLII